MLVFVVVFVLRPFVIVIVIVVIASVIVVLVGTSMSPSCLAAGLFRARTTRRPPLALSS